MLPDQAARWIATSSRDTTAAFNSGINICTATTTDFIVVGHERANVAVVGTRDGVPDYRPARQSRIEEFVNGRIGAEMVHHGGQFQYSEHTRDVVEIFGPQGERSTEPAAT